MPLSHDLPTRQAIRRRVYAHLDSLMRGLKNKDIRAHSGIILKEAGALLDFNESDLAYLTARGVDINACLPDSRKLPDVLLRNGCFSPKMIDCLRQSGYDFLSPNGWMEHCGYHLGDSPLGVAWETVAALKAQGVDFFEENKFYVRPLMSLESTYESYPERLIPLFQTRDDWIKLLSGFESQNRLRELIIGRVREIGAAANSYLGDMEMRERSLRAQALAQNAFKAWRLDGTAHKGGFSGEADGRFCHLFGAEKTRVRE